MRFEGIDALETHYKNRHQNLDLAVAARDVMLREVGFESVTFRPDRPNKVESAVPHPLPGYVLATGIEANGRIVAEVYAGAPDADLTDGDRVFVDDARLDRSVNAALVARRPGLRRVLHHDAVPAHRSPARGGGQGPHRGRGGYGRRRASPSTGPPSPPASPTCPTW